MIKKGVLVTATFILSTFIQLVSQIVVTRMFGAKLDLDIFLAAVVIPTIITTVIYGTLNDAFLPFFGEQKSKNPKESDEYFVSMLLFFLAVSLLSAAIIGFFSDALSLLLYGERGLKFVENVAVQMRYLFYSIPFSVVATLFGAYFYMNKRFSRFPIAQAIGSIANLVIIIILSPYIGIWSLIIAFILNILVQVLFVIPRLRIKSIEIVLGFFNLKYGRPILIAWVPLIIGNFALRSDAIIIRSFGASLPTGYLVYLNLISKIFSLATGVMTVGIQILLLPHLVDYVNKKQYKETINAVKKAKLIAIAVSLLVVVCLIIFSPILINLLFVGGKFTKHDSDITISLLPYFIVPAVGWGINGVFFQPLVAIKKQWALGVLNVGALFIGWVTGWLVFLPFGSLAAIASGLTVLLFIGIIGSEILWQHYKKELIER